VPGGHQLRGGAPPAPAALPELISAAQQYGVPVAAAQVHRPTLDDVFLNLTGRSLREDNSNGKAAA
jgi:ABC-2 type transport system ATP-binding protein